MKRILISFCLIITFNFAIGQTIQFGIFNNQDDLIVKVKPSTNYTTADQITDIVFTIRWLNSYNINLGSITTNYTIQKSGSESTQGSFEYQKFAFAGLPISLPENWNNNIEYEILRIPVLQIGDGNGTFQLAPIGFLPLGSGDPYIEINTFDRTNNSSPFYHDTVNNVPLPVELSSFTASLNLNSANLKWQTKTEVDNYGFEIERAALNPQPEIRPVPPKAGNPKFDKIGFVQGSGNSNSPKNYSFTDKNPSGGSRFIYRLKQIDNDGRFIYSDEIALELIPAKYELFQNYPNPFNPSTNIKFSIPKTGKISLSIYNILGEKVKDLISGIYEPGIYETAFSGKDLGSGTYIYRLQGENFVQVKKMMLIK